MLLERKLGYLNKTIEREKASSAMGKLEYGKKEH